MSINQAHLNLYPIITYAFGFTLSKLRTTDLPSSLYGAGTDNVLYLRYTEFRLVILDLNIVLHAISFRLVLSMAFKSY